MPIPLRDVGRISVIIKSDLMTDKKKLQLALRVLHRCGNTFYNLKQMDGEGFIKHIETIKEMSAEVDGALKTIQEPHETKTRSR
jgi:hypothetical protein